MKILAATALAALAIPASASAEVKSASPQHFETEAKVTVKASPAAAYQAIGRIGSWWNASHTYSGDAANLSLPLRAGACMCERIPKEQAEIEHLRVVFARPGKMLRLQGGLGPLQAGAVAGTLTFTLTPAAGGTEIALNYVVAGHVRGGLEKLAPLVDGVLAEQLGRLAKSLGQ